MTPCIRLVIITALLTAAVSVHAANGQQYLLYSPQPALPDQKSISKDGILVQKVEVQKGDTLYSLSRKFTGRGMYFPQILLFNSIKNPDLILPGRTLQIPVSQKEAHGMDRATTAPAAKAPKGAKLSTGSAKIETATDLSISDLKAVGAEKIQSSRHRKKSLQHAKQEPVADAPEMSTPKQMRSARKSKTSSPPTPRETTDTTDTVAGQKLFEAAVKAYRKDDYRTALDLFDRYLTDNYGSPLAADANLYKAECYLKLSVQ